MLAFVLQSMLRLKRRFHPQDEAAWIGYYAHGVFLALVGYLVGGSFLGRAYFDLMFQLVAIAVVLRVLAEREGERRADAEAASRDTSVPGPRAQPEVAGLTTVRESPSGS
jgi:hypothetical protein